MYEPGLIALGMKRTGSNSCSCRHTDYDVRILPPAVVNFRKVVDDLVKPYRNKIGKLHFHHALESFQTEAQSSSHDCTFAERSIPHSFLSKLFNKSFGNLECAPIFCYILSHKDQVGMLSHGLMQSFLDGIDKSFFREAGELRALGCEPFP